jgi:hypothetical protein
VEAVAKTKIPAMKPRTVAQSVAWSLYWAILAHPLELIRTVYHLMTLYRFLRLYNVERVEAIFMHDISEETGKKAAMKDECESSGNRSWST